MEQRGQYVLALTGNTDLAVRDYDNIIGYLQYALLVGDHDKFTV